MSKINVDTWEPESGTAMTLGAADSTITALGSTRVGLGVAWQAVQTTDFTAVAGRGYPCNTTSAGFTITLPSSASVGDEIALVDYAGTFDTNSLAIDPNGLNMKGSTSSLNLVTEREGVIITYADVTQGWVATSGVNSSSPSLSTNYNLDYVVIAGGGGGGFLDGGGGGAGGMKNATGLTVNEGTEYTATVGAGGSGSTSSGAKGTDGLTSSFAGSDITDISCSGGGGGGSHNSSEAGAAGGSGGGGSHGSPVPSGGSGTAGQGYDGGSGYLGGLGTNAGGGGGGKAEAGNTDGKSHGGDGIANSITGASVTYAGGGGGGMEDGVGGPAGDGGGGHGSYDSAGTGGTAGTDGLGGGGGGGGYSDSGGNGFDGGDGVVILSMMTSNYSGTTTGSPTVTTSGSNTILEFTGTGTYTG